jgi:DNA-binding response OmpR family regulator
VDVTRSVGAGGGGDGKNSLTALAVEDEAHIHELVGMHLRLEQLDVTEVADGTAALALARAQPFDVIVLDVMLVRCGTMSPHWTERSRLTTRTSRSIPRAGR